MFPHNPSLIEDPLTDDEQEQLGRHTPLWPDAIKAKLDKLSARQRLFVLFYTGSAHLNGTRAARMAGYSPDNPRGQAVQGSQLLSKVKIKDAINSIIQLSAPSLDEIKARLNRHTQATLDECLDESGDFDIKKARETGAIDMIKSLHRQEKHIEREDGSVSTEVTWKVTLVSQQAAMNTLLRAEGAFREEEAEKGPRGLSAEEQAALDDGNIESEAAAEVQQWRAEREG